MPGHGRRQDRRADGVRLQHRRGAPRRAAHPGHGAGRVRRARRAGVPAHRRPARHLGRARGNRQAGPGGPARPQEVAARRGRAEQRHARRCRAQDPAQRPEAADRGGPGPRGGPGRRGGRQGLGRDRSRHAARRGEREPGQHRSRRRRPGRADRDRRVHHGAPVVAEPMVESTAADLARNTLERARDHVLGLQHADGWWQGELETNVTMDAEDLLLREFLGLHDEAQIAAAGRWIRSQQRDDGTWANFYDGPGDLSTTVEAYVALRLAGDDVDALHMKRARGWILDQGGLEATRVFTRIWLALSGQWSWDDLPVIPPELIYLPSWFPLNIYDWGCWARQTIVALAVVQSFRPSRPLSFTVDELRTGIAPDQAAAAPWARAFGALDKALHRYDAGLHDERSAARAGRGRLRGAVRRAALRRCADWIIARQERDGCWGGIQPPWVYSIMALNLLGYELDHPVLARALAGLDRFTITEDGPDGPGRRLEACQSPVWDTVLTMIALADAGLPEDHAALAKAARWVLGEAIRGPGAWQVRRPDLAPGGWSFEFD